jgi:hypothetical protein
MMTSVLRLYAKFKTYRIKLFIASLVSIALLSPLMVFFPLIVKYKSFSHLIDFYQQGSGDTDSLVRLTIAFYFEQTTYAPGFDEDAFWSIKAGDTEQSVLTKLGQPRIKHDGLGKDNNTLWIYASNRADPGVFIFFKRDILMGADGRVKELFGELYFD